MVHQVQQMLRDAAAGTVSQSRLGEGAVHRARPDADAADRVATARSIAAATAALADFAAEAVPAASRAPAARLRAALRLVPGRVMCLRAQALPLAREYPQAAELRREAAEPLTDDATAPGYL